MIKEIVTDLEALAKPAVPATAEDEQIGQDLLDTMASREDGCVCLAANQIGSDKAIIAYEDEDEQRHVMFNPRIKQATQPFKATENCLSISKESTVTRFNVIKVSFEELEDGKLVRKEKRFTEWVAECIQHAIDHTKGRLV